MKFHASRVSRNSVEKWNSTSWHQKRREDCRVGFRVHIDDTRERDSWNTAAKRGGKNNFQPILVTIPWFWMTPFRSLNASNKRHDFRGGNCVLERAWLAIGWNIGYVCRILHVETRARYFPLYFFYLIFVSSTVFNRFQVESNDGLTIRSLSRVIPIPCNWFQSWFDDY